MKLSVFFLYLLRISEQENISVQQAVFKAKELGYEAIDIDKEELKIFPEAVKYFREAGLSICNVYGEYDLLNGICPDACELVDYAVSCGAKVAMLLPGVYDKAEFPEKIKTDDGAMLDFLRTDKKSLRALAAIKKTAEYAKQKGVYLTIESFGSPTSLTSYISQIKWLLAEVDGLHFTFDIGNFYLNGQDILRAYTEFCDKTVHVHCKDYLINPPVGHKDFSYANISVPIGRGAAPTQDIVKKFISMGYVGCFTVEYLGIENSLGVIEQSAKFMKKLIKGN